MTLVTSPRLEPAKPMASTFRMLVGRKVLVPQSSLSSELIAPRLRPASRSLYYLTEPPSSTSPEPGLRQPGSQPPILPFVGGRLHK